MKIDDFNFRPTWGYAILEISKLLKRRFEDHAKEFGDTTLSQWRVLAQIALGRDSRQASLAAAVDADPMTISGILDRLEKRGLITRYPDPTDSRAKLAAITDAGEDIVLNGREAGLGLLAAAERGLTKKEVEQLRTLLGKIRDNLQGEDIARTKELQ